MGLDALIVDDQAFCIDRLSKMIRERSPRATVRVAGSLGMALAALAERPADLVVIEYSLPDLGREAGVARLRSQTRGAVLVMDARHDPVAARACMTVGAEGYVTRSSSPELVGAAMALVMAGGRYFPEMEEPPAGEEVRRLTVRQIEVLGALMQGCTNLEIAARLGIALPTVKLHVRAILGALGARNRTEAAMIWRSEGRVA